MSENMKNKDEHNLPTVATIDSEQRAVKNRIPSVDSARTLFGQFRQAMTSVHMADAKVISLYRGVEPYDPAKLKDLGQSWRANINPREMKGSISHRANAAYDFHMDLDTRIIVSVRPQYDNPQDPTPVEDYGKIIAEEYTNTLNFDWPENYLLIDQTTRDRIKLGLGVACWTDQIDWRPKHVPKIHFFVDPKYPPLASKIPACCIRDSLPIHDLLNILDRAEESNAAGWSLSALRAAIASFWKVGNEKETNQPPSAQDEIVGHWAAFEQWRASRPSEVAVFELQDLPVVRYLIRASNSEKVSHYVDVDASAVDMPPEDFLFQKLEQFDNMSRAIWLSPYDYSEGTIGSVDGLGHDLAPYCEISARMLCSALDGGMLSGGLVLQAEQGFDADELSVLRMGPTTVIPPGLKAMSSNFNPDIGRLLELRSAVRGVWGNNVGMTRLNPELMESAARGSRSKDEVQLEKSREFRLETNSANFEYLMWTSLHREMFKRMLESALKGRSEKLPGVKEAKEFLARCIARGVPEGLLRAADKALVVEVNRSIGDGSPQVRTQIWGQMQRMKGSMDEAGRMHTDREYAASLVGYRNVDKIFPLRNRNAIPSNERSIATLENNDFLEGAYVPAGSDQIHVLHLDVHMKLLVGMAKTYTEQPDQVDPQRIMTTFSAALPNVQEHIQFLSADPTRADLVKALTAQLSELVVLYRNVESDVADLAEQQDELRRERENQVIQQVEEKMNAEARVKLRKVELDAQLEAMRQQSIADVRESKTQVQNELRRMSADAKIALDREIAQQKQALAEEVARGKMNVEQTQ